MKIDVPLYGVGLVHVRAREVDTRCQLEHGMLTAWLSGQALCTSPTAPRSATKLLQSFQYTNPTLNQLTFLVVSRLTFSPQPHPSSSIESSPSRQAGSTRLAQEIQPASSQCSLHPNFWDAPLMASSPSIGPCGLLDPCPPLSSPLATSPGPPPGTIIAWAPAQCAECRVADSAEFNAAQ
ncbi:hypothetical protein MHUMG1_02091 [Metarhizium humberi]|uniref:Uncharacterized protein n=1 Tax=Metarhizium humberi TaxID=2596975 RepID=A0A9P8MMD3_9HYPO|nr:hypothetical protein MHUMG1_02091 [Metarhizium humberi]